MIVTLFNFGNELNKADPHEVTDDGIETFVNEIHPLKLLLMDVLEISNKSHR